MYTKYLESSLKEENAVYVEDVPAGEGWLHLIKKGQTFRILDLEGNQAVDTLFINANNPEERYSVQQTVQRQANCLVGVGTVLYSNDDNPMLTITADLCGDHDTLGSACSCESNTCRYSLDISSPGKYVEMRAEMDVYAVVSNCPQLNNPCNAYNPTPIRMIIWD